MSEFRIKKDMGKKVYESPVTAGHLPLPIPETESVAAMMQVYVHMHSHKFQMKYTGGKCLFPQSWSGWENYILSSISFCFALCRLVFCTR